MSGGIAEEVENLLREQGLTLATAESATGGLIATMITDVPGSSDCFKGSVVSYANEMKMKVLGVKRETLEEHGAVSEQTAREMAEGVRVLMDADISLSDTGIAGPGGATVHKPVGLFYLGLSTKEGTIIQRHVFSGNRQENKREAGEAALSMLKEYLSKFEK
ncbi:MAG: CinA family protein [Chloroflexota bacterium]